MPSALQVTPLSTVARPAPEPAAPPAPVRRSPPAWWLASVLLLLPAVLLSGVALIHAQHQGRQLFIQLEQAQARRDALQIQWVQLTLEQGTLATAAAVDTVARKRLEMGTPAPDAVVYLRP